MISHRDGHQVTVCDGCFAVITELDDMISTTSSWTDVHGCSVSCFDKAMTAAVHQPKVTADEVELRRAKQAEGAVVVKVAA